MNKEKYLDVVLNFLCDESGIDNNAYYNSVFFLMYSHSP